MHTPFLFRSFAAKTAFCMNVQTARTNSFRKGGTFFNTPKHFPEGVLKQWTPIQTVENLTLLHFPFKISV